MNWAAKSLKALHGAGKSLSTAEIVDRMIFTSRLDRHVEIVKCCVALSRLQKRGHIDKTKNPHERGYLYQIRRDKNVML